MPPSDETRLILGANAIARCPPVRLPLGYRQTRLLLNYRPRLLLLHCPDEHEKLDEKLLALLQRLHSSQPYEPYETCADETRKIIESVTGQQPGRYCLIRPTWETDRFNGNRCVMTAWFVGRVCGKEIAEALHTVFTEMVRFILDAKTPYAQQKCRAELIEALSLYLDKRGKEVTKHPDGPEGGHWLWWDDVRYEIPKGQRYDIVNFMWGREYADFDELIDYAFKSNVSNSAITTAVNRVNDALMAIRGFPWRLATDSANRYVFWEAKTSPSPVS